MSQSNRAICLNDLIASRRDGHSMPQEFYIDAAVSPDRFAENGWDWSTARRDAQQCYETYYCLGH